MNNEKVEISKTTAWAILEAMSDWLEWIDRLDERTRRDVIALDELVKALDAEQHLTDKWYTQQKESAELNKAHKLATVQTEKAGE
jgi:hypothetical protein